MVNSICNIQLVSCHIDWASAIGCIGWASAVYIGWVSAVSSHDSGVGDPIPSSYPILEGMGSPDGG